LSRNGFGILFRTGAVTARGCVSGFYPLLNSLLGGDFGGAVPQAVGEMGLPTVSRGRYGLPPVRKIERETKRRYAMKKFNEIGDPNDAKMPLSAKNSSCCRRQRLARRVQLRHVFAAATRPTSSTTPCFSEARHSTRRPYVFVVLRSGSVYATLRNFRYFTNAYGRRSRTTKYGRPKLRSVGLVVDGTGTLPYVPSSVYDATAGPTVRT